MTTYYALKSQEQVDFMYEEVGKLVKNHGFVTVHYKVGKTRSSLQQAALEVWCRMIADMLNEQGVYRGIKSPIYLDGELEAPWQQHSVKNEIWRPIQEALTGHQSTTKPTPAQYIEIQDHLVRAFGEKECSFLPGLLGGTMGAIKEPQQMWLSVFVSGSAAIGLAALRD